jgi:hypothetical protein
VPIVCLLRPNRFTLVALGDLDPGLNFSSAPGWPGKACVDASRVKTAEDFYLGNAFV